MKTQTIIIIGASSAIGREMASSFLKKGDNVVPNASTIEKTNKLFHELGGGKRLAMVAGDVSDRVRGIKILALAVAKFGSADVLINIADGVESSPFLGVNENDLDNFLNANFKQVSL